MAGILDQKEQAVLTRFLAQGQDEGSWLLPREGLLGLGKVDHRPGRLVI